MPNLGGWEFVILIVILLLLFGAKRLPDMARSIGQSARVFKGEMKGMKGDDAAAPTPAERAAPERTVAEAPALPPSSSPAPPAAAGQSPATPPASNPAPGSTDSSRVTQPDSGQPGR